MPADTTTPQVFALPCSLCGEEAVYQLGVTYGARNGVRMAATLVKQCGCRRLVDGALIPER